MRLLFASIILHLGVSPTQMKSLSVAESVADKIDYLKEYNTKINEEQKSWRTAFKYLTGIVFRLARKEFKLAKLDQEFEEEYVGCFIDASDRAIGGGYVRLSGDTVALCVDRCRGLKTSYAAVQDRTACFCGNKYTKYGSAPASECNSPCPDNPGKCGGPFRNSVWQIDEVPSEEETEKYLGCYKDSGDRAMPGGYIRLPDATVDKCIDRCREMGTRFAAVQDRSACFCANEYKKHGAAPEEECKNPCPGNPAQKCGGPWRNSVWQLD